MSGDLFSNGGNSGHTYYTDSSNTAAQNIYNQQLWRLAADKNATLGAYQGPFLGAQSPYTVQAQQMLAQKATDPNSMAAQSSRQLGSTMSGDYLNPNSNPFFANYLNDALGQAKSQITSQFGGNAGANVNNSGFTEALARGLGGVAANASANQYNAERTNQVNAAKTAGVLAPSLDYSGANALFGAGASQEARSQAEVDAQKQAYQAQWAPLFNYLNLISGNYGGTQGQSHMYFSNPWGSAASTASSGMGMYNALNGGQPSGTIGSNYVAGGDQAGTAVYGGLGDMTGVGLGGEAGAAAGGSEGLGSLAMLALL